MTVSSQITPGMTLSLDGKVYRVESSVKVTVSKGVPFMKTKLKDLMEGKTVEKNFKLDQKVDEVTLTEQNLEYLYPEGKGFLFLNTDALEEVFVSSDVVGDKLHFLKEGVGVKALFYGETIFSVDLPQFLEIMVVKTESSEAKVTQANTDKVAILETGAKVTVPAFVESGDVIKVDTHAGEYIQRV